MANLIGGGENDLALYASSTTTVSKNIKISASAAKINDGVLLSSSNTFTVPSGCSYISINAIYSTTIDNGKSSTVDQVGCISKRFSVTAGQSYTIGTTGTLSETTSATAACYASTYWYSTNNGLSGAPAKDSHCTWYKIYTDDGVGTVYTDSTTRTTYKTVTGGTIPV